MAKKKKETKEIVYAPIVYQPIVHHPLPEMLGDATHELFFFCKLCHISVKRAQNYMKNHILSNIYL